MVVISSLNIVRNQFYSSCFDRKNKKQESVCGLSCHTDLLFSELALAETNEKIYRWFCLEFWGIYYLIQRVNKTSNVFNIFLNANSESDDQVQLVIQYTDIYHQDLTQYQMLAFNLNIFLVEPPLFVNELQIINIDRCSPYRYNFPSIVDVNNYSWDIIFNENILPWITMNSIEKYLVIDGSNKSYNIPSTVIVPIKLENEMKAFTLYNLTINVIQTRELKFDFASDIIISCWKII